MKLFDDTKRSRWVCCWGTIAAVSVVGCTHETALVREDKLDAHGKPITLPGVLFYAKKGVCNKESVWLEPQYTLTFTIAADGGLPQTRSMVLSRKGYEAPETKELFKTLTGLKNTYRVREIVHDSCPAKIGKQWDDVARIPDYKVVTDIDTNADNLGAAQKQGNILLVTNKAEIGAAPDYKRPLYLNALSPWDGSAQVNATLASDGTLTQASVQRDDETLNTILTGVTSLIGDFTGASPAASAATTPATPSTPTPSVVAPTPPFCAAADGWPGVTEKVTYTSSLKTVIYRHDHQLQSDLQGECSLGGSWVAGGNFAISVMDDESGSSKKSGKAIEFSGQVKLPEGSGKKKGDSGAGDSAD
jgi:hypothetical protein